MAESNTNSSQNNTGNSNSSSSNEVNWINNLTTGNVSEMKVVERGFSLGDKPKK